MNIAKRFGADRTRSEDQQTNIHFLHDIEQDAKTKLLAQDRSRHESPLMRMTLNRSKLPSSVQTVPQHAPFRNFTAVAVRLWRAPRSPRKRRMRKIDGIGYLIALKEEKEAIYQFASKLHIPTPPRDTLEVPVARDHEK
ncbi:hypothetical protein CIHG_05246 [Coccidioides immitis H538.4]|uniref:Uncharacterized protein n=3 Tax=Coccidioides immitis TaxID=5501 RepID=A0A0J8R0H2_COCIT|nr:hypothetical protein CIRG_08312 [Coccidioides immitis RMSCC 2394]KMU78634.1 hypothetical protein CISG_01674 [Coccidioides immitis RMSCC 3703]KMU87451.1 hypothetical protein CIHG_05246 [Coccidioides immitis H538.4]